MVFDTEGMKMNETPAIDPKLWKFIIRALALILFTLGCFYCARGYCGEKDAEKERAKQYWDMMLHPHIPTIEQCVQQINFHKKEAERLLNEVKDRCWWLPDLDDREKARHCFTLLAPLITPGMPPQARVIGTLIALFGQYGLDCIDEWHSINRKLLKAESHADQAEFWERVLIHGARSLLPRYDEDDDFSW